MATATLLSENLDKLKLNELGLDAKEHLMFRMPYESEQLVNLHKSAVKAAWEGACQRLGINASIMRQITDAETMRRLMLDALASRPRQS